eukprot:c10800_g1_i1 orf=1-279(-)
MACRDLDLLWKEDFMDPSQLGDFRNSKRGPRSPYHSHKQTEKPLCMHNPPWVIENMGRSRVQDGDLCVLKDIRKDCRDRPSLFHYIKACGKQK